MDPAKCIANYSRVCQLLVDKGGDALRAALHVVHPPSTLAAVLNANKSVLKKIRYSVINPSQWNLLYPVSGTPDSRNFDVTLLTILLRNICGLSSPATGWNAMPPASDTSISANIVRIKIFRNEVYGHTPSAELADTTFETLWQEISKPLVKLGIPQQDIDELKEVPLSPEEESYIKKLKEWKQQEDDLLSKLNDLEMGVRNVENQVVNVENQVVNAENEVVNVENQVVNVGNQVVNVGNQVLNVENQVVNVENQVVNVENQVRNVGNQVLNVENQVVNVGNQVLNVENQVRNVGNQVLNVENQVVNVENQVVNVENQVVNVGNQVVNVGNQVLNVENQVVNVENQVVNVENQVVNVENQVRNVGNQVVNVGNQVLELRRIVENPVPSQVDQLAKFDFTGKIDGLCKKSQDGTRQWFFQKLSSWFGDEDSRVMILTAGPGVGKSVLSAKVCDAYKQSGRLAAYHFCDFKKSDSRNPNRILQSLASQICDSIEGFRDKLSEILCREHTRDSMSDAFRVLFNDPLHALNSRVPMLIVIDALDESKTDDKSEFLELISDEFPELPKWIKILISSRPELQVRKKLERLNPLEILPDDHKHNLDLRDFILHCLPDMSRNDVSSLISKCEGSFLYAYYLVNELKEMGLGFEPNLSDYVPKGISGLYEKQFKRLKTGLRCFRPDTWSSILNVFVNVIAASREALPIKILFKCMGLSGAEYEIRETIIGIMSEILPLYEDCLTVYHKSLWDWLTLEGYEEHAFVADVADGIKRLWEKLVRAYTAISLL